MRRRSAPVKAPRLVAEQFTFQQRLGNGSAIDRQERGAAAAAMLVDPLATSSLPVPLSPKIRTLTSWGATRPICLQTICMAGRLPMKRSGASSGRSASSTMAGTCISRRISRAWATTCWSWAASSGLTKYSYAPRFMASMAGSAVPCPVMNTTRLFGLSPRSCSNSSRPDCWPSRISSKITSGLCSAHRASPSSAEQAASTSIPWPASTCSML